MFAYLKLQSVHLVPEGKKETVVIEMSPEAVLTALLLSGATDSTGKTEVAQVTIHSKWDEKSRKFTLSEFADYFDGIVFPGHKSR